MKLLVKLFPYDSPATDGSIIPRRVIEDYLQTEDYRDTMNQRMATGGITHLDRSLPTEGCANSSDNSGVRKVKGIIGKDDLLLLNRNITHYIENVYIENDGWVYGTVVLLDENVMDEESAKRIKQVKGLLLNGIKLHTSCVISAYWDSNEVAEKFVHLTGVDITNNEAFKGSGVVEIINE